MPDTINGWIVADWYQLIEERGMRPGAVFSAYRPMQGGGREYVVAVHCYGDNGWFWGDYRYGPDSVRQALIAKCKLHRTMALPGEKS